MTDPTGRSPAPRPGVRVLLAGESQSSFSVTVRGFDTGHSGSYVESGTALIEALEAGGCEVVYQPSHVAAARFPSDARELAAFDVVVLSDIGSDTLALHPETSRGLVRPDRLALLAEWVRGGGGLLMVGGYLSFSGRGASARYGMTPLAEVLAVECLDHDDRIETPAGVRPRPTGVDPGAILAGLPLPWPVFLGYNRVRERADSQVILRSGEDPFLALRLVGNGRSAAFASDCSPHWATAEFTGWPAYGTFWLRLVEWLAGGR